MVKAPIAASRYQERFVSSIIIWMFLFPILYFLSDHNSIVLLRQFKHNRIKTDWCKNPYAIDSSFCAKELKENLRFAYAQYATTPQYLCNTLINFSRLRSFQTEAELVLIFPEEWLPASLESSPSSERYRPFKISSGTDNDGSDAKSKHRPFIKLSAHQAQIPRLLEKAKALGVRLYPTKVLSGKNSAETWSESFTKLKILELDEYDRIIYFDSDGLVMKKMDHLFFKPDAELAMLEAYWLNDVTSDKSRTLSLYKRMLDLFKKSPSKTFDMEIMNQLSDENTLILPHRSFGMLSGEYRIKNHSKYLSSSPDVVWNADEEAAAAHYVHFSDWPLAKPWIGDRKTFALLSPRCSSPDDPCRHRYHWLKLYRDFEMMEREVCGK